MTNMNEPQKMLKPLNFKNIELLRKHIRLTIAQMSNLFDVSNVTYHKWKRGETVSQSNVKNVRMVVDHLLDLVNKGWPQSEVKGLESKDRFKKLTGLLGIK